MSKQEIVAALRAELADLPTYPEDDSNQNVTQYDEELNEQLEILRDVVRAIVEGEA